MDLEFKKVRFLEERVLIQGDICFIWGSGVEGILRLAPNADFIKMRNDYKV